MNKSVTFFLLIVWVMLSSCNKNIGISAWQPAPITVPRHVQHITILNRTLPESQVANVLEGILTGELPFQDRKAAESAIASLTGSIAESNRFRTTQYPTSMKGSGSGGILPAPLDWATVERICRETNSDAVLALETFDTDFILTNAEKIEDQKDKDGKVQKVKVFTAQGVATVKLGLRMYDVKDRRIIDQHQYDHRNTWTARGSTAAEAALALIAKNDAVLRVSSNSGFAYGKRIVPRMVTLSRPLYKKKKGNRDLERGTRKALVGDWDGSIDDWMRAAQSSSDKVAGRAAHNIAVAYEVLGDLDNSLKWAQKSYSDFGFKKALEYSSQIRRRMVDAERLKDQMQ